MKKKVVKKARKQGNILGVRLNSTTEVRVLRFVREKLSRKGRKEPFLITTPNPEIVVQAQKDERLREIVNSSDYAVPDGVGLLQAEKFLTSYDPKLVLLRLVIFPFQGLSVGLSTILSKETSFDTFNLIKGRDLFLELIKLANKKKWKVFLLGDLDESAQKAKERLESNYKRVEIFAESGPDLTKEGEPVNKNDREIERKIVSKINKVSPHLLFVGFGAPKQEKWADKWLKKLDVGGIMTVGGTLDYVSGKMKLPPKWVESIGLEWVWRLMAQPGRVKRILTAFPYFPLKVFWHKLTNNGS